MTIGQIFDIFLYFHVYWIDEKGVENDKFCSMYVYKKTCWKQFFTITNRYIYKCVFFSDEMSENSNIQVLKLLLQ